MSKKTAEAAIAKQRLATFLQQGRFDAARKEGESLLSKTVGDGEVLFLMSAICGQLGDFEAAEVYSQQVVRLRPDLFAGYFNLAIARQRLGKLDAAQVAFEKAIQLDPLNADAAKGLADVFQITNRISLAVEWYRKAISLRAGFIDALLNLGVGLEKLNQLEDAEHNYRKVLACSPGQPAALGLLGKLLVRSDRLAEALDCCQQQVAQAAGDADVYVQLGNVQYELGQYRESIQSYRQATELNPRFGDAWNNLGNALKKERLISEAIDAYRHALALKPESAGTHMNLGVVLTGDGELLGALASLQRALELQPDMWAGYFNLAAAQEKVFAYTDAVKNLHVALQGDPAMREARINLGNILLAEGRVEEALHEYDKALELDSECQIVASNRLMAMNYLDTFSNSEKYAAHRGWAGRYIEGLEVPKPKAGRQLGKRPVRIGYLSPDFRRHSVAYFIEPLLEQYDKSVFEVYCYSNVRRRDGVTAHFEQLIGGNWRDIYTKSDAEVVRLIRGDGIDILVDLVGHMADNRSGVFAQQAAAVQINYLGYPNTSGLPTMNYRLTDSVADPPDTEECFTETLLRLPGCFLCFRPGENAPDTGALPAQRNGYVTYGSFNNLAKVGERTIAVWSEILLRVPGSRLRVKSKLFGDEHACERFRQRFYAHGVEASRLVLISYQVGVTEHLAEYREVDVALDTFPYNGTTTTCEALWMGVPVVTFPGDCHAGRVGASLLASVGKAEWVGADNRDYIDIATSLAADTERLAGIRATLREDVAASSLCDERGFVARVEQTLLQLQDAVD